MAQYRLSVTLAKRSTGRKVVAMAAYRSGERLDDKHYGESQDYSHRAGVVHSEIVLPDNAPDWAPDRADLWSAVEDREKGDKAQLAREVQLSLPHEMNEAQRVELVQEFARHVADEYGIAVDMNIHAPSEAGDSRNHHAHLLLTTRAFDEDRGDGWAKAKDRRFDGIAMQRAGESNAVDEMREAWETIQNRALERADIRDADGQLIQVDRRSYEDRGLEIEPTIKLGPAASEMLRNGEDSDRANINDGIRQRNENAADRAADRPTDREETSREVEAIRLEMDELFDDLASRPGQALQFKRRQRELEALHNEVSELLNGPEQRESDRMNELLLSGPIDIDRRSYGGLDLDNEPQRRSRFYGLDEMNRELAEDEDERGKDREKGKGKQQLLDTYPRHEDIERPPPPEPEWPSFGRGR